MDNIIWKDFVTTIRESGKPSRKSAAGIKSAIQQLTGQGGNEGGNPTGMTKVKKPLKKKRNRDDISAPPGAPAGGAIGNPGPAAIEEDVEEASFEIHPTLAPDLWDGETLKPKIAKNLMKVATNFIEGFPVPIKIKDVRLTGSLANYNWSNYSDVDLHIIVDFSEVDENTELVKSLFDNARLRWNNIHHITMKGYDVEIYVEDEGEEHVASGLYSIMNEKWINEPNPDEKPIDFDAAKHKAQDIEFQINSAANLVTARNYKSAIKTITRLKEKIKNMRRAGLEGPNEEFSVENIAFKILRREGLLDFLEDLKRRVYDEMLTVKEE
tara:strand:+ start:141 stop:1115 length:975 start_codon:yes stop_codon:yes gene_type:complete